MEALRTVQPTGAVHRIRPLTPMGLNIGNFMKGRRGRLALSYSSSGVPWPESEGVGARNSVAEYERRSV